MVYYTLKRAAGEVSFAPDQIVELTTEVAEPLIKAGAIRLIESATRKVEEKKKPRSKSSGTDSDG
jgi:hypothetical protein